jgi:hypothetical protein
LKRDLISEIYPIILIILIDSSYKDWAVGESNNLLSNPLSAVEANRCDPDDS